jgi:intracellular septation protein
MKLLFDLFPVILFFIAFKAYDIFVATAVAIAATMAQIIYMKIKHGKVEKMLVASGLIIAILGGTTLLLHDKQFIMWKPTVLYWLLALTILISGLVYKKYYVKDVLQKHLSSWDYSTFMSLLILAKTLG